MEAFWAMSTWRVPESSPKNKTHARHRLVVFDVVLRQRPEREKMCVSGQREKDKIVVTKFVFLR